MTKPYPDNEFVDGGPAFPTEQPGGPANTRTLFPGMSLRDYFAAKAMQGLLAQHRAKDLTDPDVNPRYERDFEPVYASPFVSMRDQDYCDQLAEDAYAIADWMLLSRAGRGGR